MKLFGLSGPKELLVFVGKVTLSGDALGRTISAQVGLGLFRSGVRLIRDVFFKGMIRKVRGNDLRRIIVDSRRIRVARSRIRVASSRIRAASSKIRAASCKIRAASSRIRERMFHYS